MIVRLTGAHNAESAETRLSGLVINGRIALDAGSLTRSLSIDELGRVRHVFLTHRHYDHIRDLPALAYATPTAGTLYVYGLRDTLQALGEHLMNDVIYSAYQKRENPDGTPRVRFIEVEADQPVSVEDCLVTPRSVRHTLPALGFQVDSGTARIFYTGDTGPGFSESLLDSPPDLLITEVTYGNDGEAQAARNGHLTPALLRNEIEALVETSGWRPRIVVVHRNPAHDLDIASQIQALAAETGWDIAIGQADMVIEV